MAFPNPSPDKSRYLVLESGQTTPVTRALYEHAENPDWVYLFADTEWQLYLTESPIVLKAAQHSPEYQWALKGLKEGRLIGLILESSEALEPVANWLRARLKVRFDGRRHGLLRFYDPRIWHQLSPTSGSEANVIERAIYWYGAPGDERWQTTEKPNLFAMLPVPTLDESQWQALNATTA
ncbi:DUF4123 domain-containing protein [Marinobacter halophilus]|uniref:DUF4123 domain-containing protein n=1 Tax=Marinobacter halophilus TaxID=1323740 RepID=UPI001D0F80E4|nr:DUF4123 domain-containing protein [Marinobacter halophilus]